MSCNTNCIEKPLSIGFAAFGGIVGRYPYWFIITSLIASGGFGAGFYFLTEHEVKGIEEQFTPINGPAKLDREDVKVHFPHGEEFSQIRLFTEGVYASFILTHPDNVLTAEVLKYAEALNDKIQDLRTNDSNNFMKLCAKTNGQCVPLKGLDVLRQYVTGTVLHYPDNGLNFTGTVLGGVRLQANSDLVERAEAVRVFYHLKEDNLLKSDEWLRLFVANLSAETQDDTISLSYFTSLSRQEEFESNTDSIVPFFSITYFLAITVSIISCTRLDCVRNKVWVAWSGVISAGLAVLSSFGLLLYCGMPFSVTVANAAFLVLGIGVDDMFIMISCWQKTKVSDNVEDRMAETYKEAAVSITITTLTDVLAFYIGLLTPFLSVQSFCMYTGTALLFCYIYNITFFGACLALNGQREKSNRHWLTCMVVKKPNETNEKNPCTVGGAYDLETKAEEEMAVNVFFKKYYGPFLTNCWVKLLVLLIYLGYLASSIYGCLQIKEGIDLKNLATDGSYVGSYYDAEDKFEYGPNVMLIIKDEGFKYWSECSREQLDMCLTELENSEMVVKNSYLSWLHSYVRYAKLNSLNISGQDAFLKGLPTFLNLSGFSEDVNISDGKIQASRLFIQTVNITTAIEENEMLQFFRDTVAKCSTRMGVDLFVYHPAFVYFDQYAVIVSNTIQNVVIATAVMLVISLLLIPNPLCSVWVTFAIASVIVGVAGFMALWGVNLDSISMINLVICIGFSVDFSAHISYAFVSSKKATANERAIEAFHSLGYPIIQGAITTITGVVVLSASESYIFRTFFKIMFLVISFGALHGIVFLPVFLTFFGCCNNGSVQQEMDHSMPEYYSNPMHTTPASVTCSTKPPEYGLDRHYGNSQKRFTEPHCAPHNNGMAHFKMATTYKHQSNSNNNLNTHNRQDCP